MPHPPTRWPEHVKNGLLLVVVIAPLLLLLVVAGVVAGAGYLMWDARQKAWLALRRTLGYQPPPPPLPEPEQPKELLVNDQLRLLTTEADWETNGPEFREWLYLWGELEDEFGRYPSLFCLHTEPEISGLHGQLITDLCRTDAAGVFLQLLEPRPGQQPAGTSWLGYLEFATRQWQYVTETSDFYLLPEEAGGPYNFSGIQVGGGRLTLQAQPAEPAP
ncbi:hypothetical protein [Hymenobacter rigui]|uniref:Uncharacterized protein n=1 Tax=Hymenobacter rigui TaxID=334424 RepID=A0A3R9MNZ2_9BACT|nr:hypothetical protein [Hymenobacter rigui]RSK50237.1 hypothetical protein EI291_06175 [Hymenobacter rigui]